ncbi:MBL fold metallo-hydrolase [Pararhodobacter zhoushanensis]|uniref:MBL fold metallo-hydrolase n=1 Tax=Pararhodobacter zhoushanensis TaxID=2479545 RepID=UPI000F8E583F|nr:MBL fold metallo-hydrolase [Pararhodobacter zhoushanensis]
MTITRRAFTLGATALTAGGLLTRRARAQATTEFGAMRVEMLSDGNLSLPRDFTLGTMPQPEADTILARYGLGDGPLTPPCNVTLLRHEDRVILFDIGAGPDFQPSAGMLPDTLDAAGISPDEITHLVITHGHPDHIWGLLDDFDEPYLPNAQILMGRAEFDYWMDDNTVSTIDSGRQTFAVGAQRRLATVADLVTFFEDGQEILPGIAARATYGHTPGHMAFELRDGSDSLMVVGDSLGNHHVAFERPEWDSGSDQDAPTAAATRVRLLDQLAQSQMLIAGFHLPGGLGRVERADSGYRFVPA